jgi:hypothetical protein
LLEILRTSVYTAQMTVLDDNNIDCIDESVDSTSIQRKPHAMQLLWIIFDYANTATWKTAKSYDTGAIAAWYINRKL